MNEGNSRGVNVDLNMLNKPGTFLSAHALALYNWLKTPQGLDDSLTSSDFVSSVCLQHADLTLVTLLGLKETLN